MEKIRKIKNKILMFVFALIFPLSACGMVYSLTNLSVAKAESSGTQYSKSYVSEVSLSNNSFNSSSSNYTLSTSLTGWTGQVNDRKTTAGIISVGPTFQNYMSGTYYLSNNPLAKGSDNHILMINSRTSSDTSYSPAKQGYRSGDVTLEANSYYSFQVSFKSDSNYSSSDTYVQSGQIETEPATITKYTFNGGSNSETLVGFGEDSYISFSYHSQYYYLQKTLSEEHTTLSAQTDVEVFYEDDEYVGIMNGETPVYVPLEDVEGEVVTDGKVNIIEGARAYTCNIQYDPDGANGNGNYVVPVGTPYYSRQVIYDPMSASTYGSIYLTGLVDEDGNTVEAQYTKVTSKEWVTFYFFVATGDESQTINLDLWLGSTDTTVSGVVFFDECKIYQYSENAFWKNYNQYYGKNYTQEYATSDGRTETVVTNCTSLVDLRDEKENEYADMNFDFEKGIYNDEISSLENWTKDEHSTGNARVFDATSPEFFKSTTGYDFVGSNLGCKVMLENDEIVSIQDNRYVLGLWAENKYVKVTSEDIDIKANEIYKISAQYKISYLESGSVYLYVQENDNVLTKYNLSDTQYSISAEQASSAVTENGDNSFTNDYATIEFYVKGSARYDSSINISLGLGSSSESATGCVVFDDITIEKATTDEFSSATNAYELGVLETSPTVTNGNFDSVTISSADATAPFAPEGWTIESGDGFSFGGVINVEEDKFAEYLSAYEENQGNLDTADLNNPYYWASYGNPMNSYGVADADNILMLANITSNWQTLQSSNISLSASTAYKLSFDYKTFNTNTATPAKFKVSIFSSEGFKLFESDQISSTSSTKRGWETYEIYLQSFSGASEIYVLIEFGDENTQNTGFAYFDNFRLNDGVTIPDSDTINLVDMSDFYMNIPTNDITSDLDTTSTPAYTGSVANGSSSGITGGIVKSDKFDENSNFYISKEDEDDEAENVFFIQSQGAGSYTIQSNFNLDLSADTYYSLTFKLKTYFAENNLDEDFDYSYGVTIGITGFDYVTELKSNEEYGEYTIYFHPSSDVSGQLYIALVCDTNETAGSMAIYDIALNTVDENAYTSAQEIVGGRRYDVNSDRVAIASQTDAEDDNTGSDDETTTDDENTGSTNFSWLYIPTIIFGVAIIVAVVGYFLRKIDVKKVEKKRKETYDRKQSLNVDTVKLKARQERDKEVAEIQSTIDKFQAELNNLEKEHKQKVITLREKDKGKVSKETDREFKQYAQKHTVIVERIESLNKQVADMKTPEYLLSLERKVFAQEEMKQKELAKASKILNKENKTKSEGKTETTTSSEKKTSKKSNNKIEEDVTSEISSKKKKK